MGDMLTFELQPGGSDVEKNNFHTLDAYLGQTERSDVYDYGSELNLQMNLVEIVHGTIDSSPNSLPATLIIADFHFTSRDTSRRFRKATIELRFRDLSPGDANPPEVFAIAPDGVFRMDKTEKTQELKRGGKADVGAAFVANVSTGVEWSLTETQTKYKTAKLTGVKTKKGRNTEPKNVAMWSMDENENDGNGIPSLLRASILLRRKRNEQFHCGVLVDAKVGRWKSIHLESRAAGGDIDPVLFDPNKERSTSVPPYIDPKNLGSVVLSKLMAIQSNTAIETVVTAQSNAVTDGHVSGLTLDGVMGKLEDPVAKSADQQASASTPKSEMHIAEKVENPISNFVGRQISALTQNETRTTSKLEEPISKPADGQVAGLALENVIRTTQKKVEEHVQRSGAASEPARNGLGSAEHASLEETMRLLLHAVRKGVEVIAEANRIKLEAWPEPQQTKNLSASAVAKDERSEDDFEKET